MKLADILYGSIVLAVLLAVAILFGVAVSGCGGTEGIPVPAGSYIPDCGICTQVWECGPGEEEWWWTHTVKLPCDDYLLNSNNEFVCVSDGHVLPCEYTCDG